MQVREAYWQIGTPIFVLSRALQLSADFLEDCLPYPRSATAVFAAPSQSSLIVCQCNMSQIWSFYTLSIYFQKKKVSIKQEIRSRKFRHRFDTVQIGSFRLPEYSLVLWLQLNHDTHTVQNTKIERHVTESITFTIWCKSCWTSSGM